MLTSEYNFREQVAMCELCDDDLDALLEAVHERHDAEDRPHALKALRAAVNAAVTRAREDVNDAEDAGDPDDHLFEDEDVLDEDEDE